MSPAEALRGCAVRVDAEAARALGARAAGLATGNSAFPAVVAPSATGLSEPGAGGGVLLSISISPMGCVLLQENNVRGLTDGGHDDSADMSVTSIDWMTFADCFLPFFDFWCELGGNSAAACRPRPSSGSRSRHRQMLLSILWTMFSTASGMSLIVRHNGKNRFTILGEEIQRPLS